MSSIVFIVRSQAVDPYRVTIFEDSTGLRMTCTCPKAVSGSACEHREKILSGEHKGIISTNAHLVSNGVVREMFKASPVIDALDLLNQAKDKRAVADVGVRAARRRFSKLLSSL